MRPVRVALSGDLSPAEAVGWLRGEERPFALAGEWLGGFSVLGSAPARVLAPERGPVRRGRCAAGAVRRLRLRGGPRGRRLGRVAGLRPRRAGRASCARPAGAGPAAGLLARLLRPRARARRHAVVVRGAVVSRARRRPPGPPGVVAPAATTMPVLPDGADAPRTPFRLTANGAARAPGGGGRLPASGSRPASSTRPTCASGSRRASPAIPLDLFVRALPAAAPRFGAYVDGVVSLSPERFLRRAGREVWTEPIKGTRPRVGGEAARLAALRELAASEKDAAEHVMIVDLMRNDLGRVCRYGSVRAEPPRIEPHAGVWHLVSTVSGALRDGVGDGELLRASFPPGSVTGAPKVQAMKVIAALEATRREVYTGAIGIASPLAGLDLSVAIRTFEVAGGCDLAGRRRRGGRRLRSPSASWPRRSTRRRVRSPRSVARSCGPGSAGPPRRWRAAGAASARAGPRHAARPGLRRVRDRAGGARPPGRARAPSGPTGRLGRASVRRAAPRHGAGRGPGRRGGVGRHAPSADARHGRPVRRGADQRVGGRPAARRAVAAASRSRCRVAWAPTSGETGVCSAR